jgi:Na+/alanine symporter
MEWILIAGIALIGLGILVGLYLPILAAQFLAPEKIRIFAIIGAILVVIGTALEVVTVWPAADVDAGQTTPD